MITNTQRKRMAKRLGKAFIADVLQVLSEKQIVNEKGKPYEKTYVSHVFNGRHSNLEIENAIFDVYKKRKEEQQKINVARKNAL